jgi:hypothetical protein
MLPREGFGSGANVGVQITFRKDDGYRPMQQATYLSTSLQLPNSYLYGSDCAEPFLFGANCSVPSRRFASREFDHTRVDQKDV